MPPQHYYVRVLSIDFGEREVKCELQFFDRIRQVMLHASCIPQANYVTEGDMCHFFGGLWADYILANDDNPAALITVRIPKEPTRPSDLVHVDALAGIGGFRHAAMALGITTVSVIEWDPNVAALYKSNDSTHTPMHIEDITRIQGWFEYMIDVGGAPVLLTAGIVCPPWSGAGESRGYWDRRGLLIFWFARLSFVLATWADDYEQVDGFLRHLSGDSLRFAEAYFRTHGMELVIRKAEAACFVPQIRSRIFIHTAKSEDHRQRLQSVQKTIPTQLLHKDKDRTAIAATTLHPERVHRSMYLAEFDHLFWDPAYFPWRGYRRIYHPDEVVATFMHNYGRQHTLPYAIAKKSIHGFGVDAGLGARFFHPREVARRCGMSDQLQIGVSDGQPEETVPETVLHAMSSLGNSLPPPMAVHAVTLACWARFGRPNAVESADRQVMGYMSKLLVAGASPLRALDARAQQAATWQQMDDGLLGVDVPLSTARQNVAREAVRTMCLGLTSTYDGRLTISTHTQDFQQLVHWLTASARALLPLTSFTSIQVNVGFACQVHVDANNEGPSMIVGFGQYIGGQLWLHDH